MQPHSVRTALPGELSASSGPVPERFTDLLQDYWNEWAGVLSWIRSSASVEEQHYAFTQQVQKTGGNLVRTFFERFPEAEQQKLVTPREIAWVAALDRLANRVNLEYSAGQFDSARFERYAAEARYLIYELPNRPAESP